MSGARISRQTLLLHSQNAVDSRSGYCCAWSPCCIVRVSVVLELALIPICLVTSVSLWSLSWAAALGLQLAQK
eukprot:3352507-Amphidinium_carterae.1